MSEHELTGWLIFAALLGVIFLAVRRTKDGDARAKEGRPYNRRQ